MSKLAQSLAELAISAQAEFDEKTRLVDELAEKAAEISEMKRQLDKVYKRLTEQNVEGTASASGTAQAAETSSEPSSRREKLSTDALSNVLAFLNRVHVDAAQITCRPWRHTVETMLTTKCLRELTYVTLKRETKSMVAGTEPCRPAVQRNRRSGGRRREWTSWWSDSESELYRNTVEDADCNFVLSVHRTGETSAPLGGSMHEDVQRRLTFQSCEAASDYLLRLIPSATIKDFTLDSLVPRNDFFDGLLSIAATVRVEHLFLADCHLDDVDAGSFHPALLRFQSISELVVGFRLLPGHISDGFLADAGRKPGLTQLCYDTTTPIGPATFDATDFGLMQFLFQRTVDGEVKLHISHVNISQMFCTAIFKKALSEPTKHDVWLLLRVRNVKQDLTGILGWRLTKDKSIGNMEVYTAEDSHGKRICLTITTKSDGTVSGIEFRRSKHCQCKSGWRNSHHDNFNSVVNDFDAGDDRGFGGFGNFNNDCWD
ncbi:hypothetical protein AAVH_19353 [Aphelenchoides avenae]|nr:hypothetical protein AAVH_19353 [Aphelenchus avenae]